MVEQGKGCITKSLYGSTRDPITVKIGDKFEVRAEENPSTGLVWMLLDEELEFHNLKGVVKISDSRYEKPARKEDKPILLGAPGTRILELEALSEGNG